VGALLSASQVKAENEVIMERKRTARQKLAEFFPPGTQTREKLADAAKELAALLRPTSSEEEPVWSDPLIHGQIASAALTLTPGSRASAPVEAAFKLAGLDPENPLSWPALMHVLCLPFGETKQGGAPIKWNTDRYCRLLKDFHRRKLRNRSQSNGQVCRLLGSEPQYKTKNGKAVSADRMMKVLKEALDPDRNVRLNSKVEQTIEGVRNDYKHLGWEWRPEFSELTRRIVVATNAWEIATSSRADLEALSRVLNRLQRETRPSKL
jgi:hypothetical protein